jgi:hypothetical protein
MALSILDGNQTATTLSTILSSGQHITAHTVVSLGTQAKTDILSAVSSGIAISGAVTANLSNANLYDQGILDGGDNLKVGLYSINGNGAPTWLADGGGNVPISGTVTANPTGTQTIAGTVTIGAGTAQIGSVTASISNSLTIASLPALAAGTAQIGSVTASISNSAVTVYPAQGTSVTNSNFTSLTSSTSLVSAVAGREVLTVFNEGAGNLHISPGATCTTVSYQVRLSAGDYWECPAGQLSLAHTAVFATAGTARVTEVN